MKIVKMSSQTKSLTISSKQVRHQMMQPRHQTSHHLDPGIDDDATIAVDDVIASAAVVATAAGDIPAKFTSFPANCALTSGA